MRITLKINHQSKNNQMTRRVELASAVATIKAKRNGGIPRVGQLKLTDKTLYLNVKIKGNAGKLINGHFKSSGQYS